MTSNPAGYEPRFRRTIVTGIVSIAAIGAAVTVWGPWSARSDVDDAGAIAVFRGPDVPISTANVGPVETAPAPLAVRSLAEMSLIQRQLAVRAMPNDEARAARLRSLLQERLATFRLPVSVDSVIVAGNHREIVGTVRSPTPESDQEAIDTLKGPQLGEMIAGVGMRNVSDVTINKPNEQDLEFIVHADL